MAVDPSTCNQSDHKDHGADQIDTNDVDQYYNVYMITSLSLPINHIAIFVETHETGAATGHIYQVSGNIQQGMYHNHHQVAKPEDDLDSPFISKSLLGKVSEADYKSGRFRQICDDVEPPPKQFDGPRRLFPRQKLRRCGEWASDAVEALKKGHVLVPE